MSNTNFSDHHFVKSELIRTVFEEHPHWKNRQIIEEVKKRWNVNCSSQIVISAIGKQRNRVTYTGKVDRMALAKDYLKNFCNDLSLAFYWMKKAAA